VGFRLTVMRVTDKQVDQDSPLVSDLHPRLDGPGPRRGGGPVWFRGGGPRGARDESKLAAGIPLSVAAFLILAIIDAITKPGAGVALLGALAAFYGMFLLSGRLGVTNAQAERLLIELDQSRKAEARADRLAERQRLAREMHDVLAHSLSGLMIQLDGARPRAAAGPGLRVRGRSGDSMRVDRVR
jgi:Histidine kinase